MTEASIHEVLSHAGRQLAENCESPRLDAEVLLCHCLGKPRSYLRAWPEKLIDARMHAEYQDIVNQRLRGLPVAYLTGVREFWSREFLVSSDVLIPRPDTELLIELGLARIPPDRPVSVIDLGTGSGVIAVTLASERPLASITATDSSAAALKIARQNARRHHLDGIRFVQSDWLNGIKTCAFDLVLSNPPYIAAGDPHLQNGDVRFEPKHALIADESGLRDIRTIIQNARRYLRPNGHILIEHGYNQQLPVRQIMKSCHYRQINTYTDLSGNPRVTCGAWNPQ